MIRLLTRLLGRLPIGLLQLTHNRGRLLAALAGVAFANVLVFVQLGLAGSMTESVATPYRLFRPDLLLVSAGESDTLSDKATIPRQRLYQAMGHPDVAGGLPLYVGQTTWLPGGTGSVSLMLLGLSPNAGEFVREDLAAPIARLAIEDTVIVDLRTRFVNMGRFETSRPDAPVSFELQNRRLNSVGTQSIGGGFGGDGLFMVSDQAFFHLFPKRSAATPNHVLVSLRPGADPLTVAEELRSYFPEDSVRLRTVAQAITDEQRYQMTKRPTGLIFAFGVVIGLLVGAVIAYQVLSTDVADHLKEYATLKAMGYPSQFFGSIVLEQAVILAVVGFWPGLLLSHWFYEALASVAGIPIFMTMDRAIAVLTGTVVACSVSGRLAMRRLAAADPAELF